MREPRRRSGLLEPLRGAGFVVGLGLLLVVVAGLIAETLVRIMT